MPKVKLDIVVRYRHYAMVRRMGGDLFPLDLLSQEEAFPVHESDSINLTGDPEDAESDIVHITKFSPILRPTWAVADWKRRGWELLAVQGPLWFWDLREPKAFGEAYVKQGLQPAVEGRRIWPPFRYIHTAMAVGQSLFPFDMLRYDQCFPLRYDRDSSHTDKVEVAAYACGTNPERVWHAARWSSFGWHLQCD